MLENNNIIKICSTCKIEKSISNFFKKKSSYKSQCKECEKKTQKLWRSKNKEILKIKRSENYLKNKSIELFNIRKWQINNKERDKHNKKIYFQKNKDKLNLKSIEYYKKNYEKDLAKKKANTANWRAKKLNIDGILTSVDIKEIFNNQNGKCFYCLSYLDNNYQIDHEISLTKGGTNHPINIRVSCRKCNQKKYNKSANEIFF